MDSNEKRKISDLESDINYQKLMKDDRGRHRVKRQSSVNVRIKSDSKESQDVRQEETVETKRNTETSDFVAQDQTVKEQATDPPRFDKTPSLEVTEKLSSRVEEKGPTISPEDSNPSKIKQIPSSEYLRRMKSCRKRGRKHKY